MSHELNVISWQTTPNIYYELNMHLQYLFKKQRKHWFKSWHRWAIMTVYNNTIMHALLVWLFLWLLFGKMYNIVLGYKNLGQYLGGELLMCSWLLLRLVVYTFNRTYINIKATWKARKFCIKLSVWQMFCIHITLINIIRQLRLAWKGFGFSSELPRILHLYLICFLCSFIFAVQLVNHC